MFFFVGAFFPPSLGLFLLQFSTQTVAKMVSYSMSYCNCPQANLRAPKNENTKSTLCIYMEKSSLTLVTPSIGFSGDRFEASSLASVSEWSVFG